MSTRIGASETAIRYAQISSIMVYSNNILLAQIYLLFL